MTRDELIRERVLACISDIDVLRAVLVSMPLPDLTTGQMQESCIGSLETSLRSALRDAQMLAEYATLAQRKE